MDHSKFAVRLIHSLNDAMPGTQFRDAEKSWLDINESLNIRVLRGWRGYRNSCYLGLFDGDGQSDYILELDTSLAVERNGQFTWSLNKPTRPETLIALENALGDLQTRDASYKTIVRSMKEERGQPAIVDRTGYLLAVGINYDSIVVALLALLERVAREHRQPWPVRKLELDLLPKLSEVNTSFQKLVSNSAKNSTTERRARLQKAAAKPIQSIAITTVYSRNPDVVVEVLLRAKGICEACGQAAPFKRKKDGSPYLEVHHRIQLADDGDDTVENAIALCPNCHRRSHYG